MRCCTPYRKNKIFLEASFLSTKIQSLVSFPEINGEKAIEQDDHGIDEVYDRSVQTAFQNACKGHKNEGDKKAGNAL